MKKALFFGLAVFTCGLFSQEGSDEKTKISPKQVYVNEQGVFILLNHELIPVEIYHDSDGLIIKPRYQKRGWVLFWECNCGALNSSLVSKCQNCGQGRYDYSEGPQ